MTELPLLLLDPSRKCVVEAAAAEAVKPWFLLADLISFCGLVWQVLTVGLAYSVACVFIIWDLARHYAAFCWYKCC